MNGLLKTHEWQEMGNGVDGRWNGWEMEWMGDGMDGIWNGWEQ